VVRIDDAHHNSKYDDRYNGAFEIRPGLNQISIDLRQVRDAPLVRSMDMTAVRYLYIFTYEPPESLVLYLDEIRLERLPPNQPGAD
jgi:hypothetical protein